MPVGGAGREAVRINARARDPALPGVARQRTTVDNEAEQRTVFVAIGWCVRALGRNSVSIGDTDNLSIEQRPPQRRFTRYNVPAQCVCAHGTWEQAPWQTQDGTLNGASGDLNTVCTTEMLVGRVAAH